MADERSFLSSAVDVQHEEDTPVTAVVVEIALVMFIAGAAMLEIVNVNYTFTTASKIIPANNHHESHTGNDTAEWMMDNTNIDMSWIHAHDYIEYITHFIKEVSYIVYSRMSQQRTYVFK